AHYSISAQVNPLTTPSSGYQQNTAATRPSSPAGSGPETPVSRAGPPPTPHPEPAATPGGSGPPQPPARPAHTPSRRATATSAALRRQAASAQPAAANPPRAGGPRWQCAPGPHPRTPRSQPTPAPEQTRRRDPGPRSPGTAPRWCRDRQQQAAAAG